MTFDSGRAGKWAKSRLLPSAQSNNRVVDKGSLHHNNRRRHFKDVQTHAWEAKDETAK
jgi:hypothetical protein